MAQHGYLHDSYDSDDFGRGDDRDRDWRDRDRERGEWRGGDRHERDRNFMFDDRDRYGRDDDRDEGFFGRMGDRARDLFRDDDRHSGRSDWRGSERGQSGYGREHGYGGFQGDYGRSGRDQGDFGGRGDYQQGSGRRFSAHTDDHYRSWRDRQMQALDKDYEDYCREREQQFHQDFDTWRSQRTKGNQQPLRTGMTQSAEEVMDLTDETTQGRPTETSTPMGAATVGTNSSTDSTPGRGKR